MKNQWLAYGVGVMLIFGAGFWASILPVDYYTVILMMGLPSLVAGYIFAEVVMQYVWGLLLGVALYMGFEFMLYGPIYKASGPVYGAGFVLGIACALTGTWWYNWRTAKALEA